MINAYFDAKAFMQATDQVREARGITRHQVWHETGIQMMTLNKILQGKAAFSLPPLATLSIWANIDVRPFMKKYEERTA